MHYTDRKLRSNVWNRLRVRRAAEDTTHGLEIPQVPDDNEPPPSMGVSGKLLLDGVHHSRHCAGRAPCDCASSLSLDSSQLSAPPRRSRNVLYVHAPEHMKHSKYNALRAIDSILSR